MKIYVSEKEKDFIDACLSESSCYSFVENTTDYEDWLQLYSLEQHDKELLKEFALEIINWSLPKYGEDIQIQVAIDFETKIRKMLKERGVE